MRSGAPRRRAGSGRLGSYLRRVVCSCALSLHAYTEAIRARFRRRVKLAPCSGVVAHRIDAAVVAICSGALITGEALALAPGPDSAEFPGWRRGVSGGA
ncbi:hypothetical protein GCM10010372_13380 [Streptomyces tauricus]|nr:hypothetical protein GCM10010372_13380 [Streptomyces tauricus]